MDLSILLVQYRPDEGELRRTLASLLRQSCRDFELVVADDGSDEDFFPLTRKILAENGFTGAKFVKLTPNGGTVKNVLNGAKQAAGKWVFTVSPGDYLYDADTVAWLLEVLRRDAPRVAFGRLACYADRNGAPIRRPGDAPFDRTPYRPGAYDAKTAKRNMLLYDDGISGAGLVYERELLVQALEKMAAAYCWPRISPRGSLPWKTSRWSAMTAALRGMRSAPAFPPTRARAPGCCATGVPW